MIRLKDINRERIRALYNDCRYQTYFDVGLFLTLIFSFHILYVIWEGPLDFWPIKGTVDKLFGWASRLLFNQSTYTLDHVFRMDFFTKGQSIIFENYHDSYSAVTVAPECTSLKQWLHWLFLMLLFPGAMEAQSMVYTSRISHHRVHQCGENRRNSPVFKTIP